VSLLQDSLDRVLVARWAGFAAAGHYQVARALWEVLGTLNAFPFQMLFARLSRLFATRTAESEAEARQLFGAAVDRLLFLVTPAALLLWALRDVVVSMLYGAAFLPAAAPLTALSAAALLQTALNPYHFVLYALDAHARFVPIVFARFVLYVVALAVLVPTAGAVGAALVRLLIVVVPAWTFVRWAREMAGVRFPAVTWLYLAAFAAGAAASEAARFALGPLGWPAVPVGAAVAALATAAAIVAVGHPAPWANLTYAAHVLRPPRRAE
jgi:O-antigen/teichoic acid export membrane protein